MADMEEPGWFTKFKETLNIKLETINSRMDEVDRKLAEFQLIKKKPLMKIDP